MKQLTDLHLSIMKIIPGLRIEEWPTASPLDAVHDYFCNYLALLVAFDQTTHARHEQIMLNLWYIDELKKQGYE